MTQTALLITRPYASAMRFEARVSQDVRRSANIVISPMLEIVPTGVQPDLANYSGVIFTSANAVALMPEGAGKSAYCVGSVTAERAKTAGWMVLAQELNADDLVVRVTGLTPKGPLLHLAGQHRRGDIAARLTAMGIKTDVEVLYDQEPMPLSAQARVLFEGEGPIVVPLFSPRSATQFIEQAPHLRGVTLVCISDAVAEQCQGSGVASVVTVPTPTGQEMLLTVEKVLRGTSLA
jgi:uroporphyrinogen-III synthase